MRIVILLALALSSPMVHAEVYKCIGSGGKTSYQARPCQTATKEQQLDIKSDPVKEAEAKAKLESVRSEYESRKAARAEAEKAQAEQRREAMKADAARRIAEAQHEQAEAQHRQADALERQNNQDIDRPVVLVTPPAPQQPSLAPAVNLSPGSDSNDKP